MGSKESDILEKFSDLKCPKGIKITQKLLEKGKCLKNEIHWCDSDNQTCEFSVPFANSWVCQCPTREEIYKRLRT
jgi:hypothetical protein